MLIGVKVLAGIPPLQRKPDVQRLDLWMSGFFNGDSIMILSFLRFLYNIIITHDARFCTLGFLRSKKHRGAGYHGAELSVIRDNAMQFDTSNALEPIKAFKAFRASCVNGIGGGR